MTAFQNLFQTLYNIGLYDVMLPFMLIFVLVFAILQKSNILSDDAKEARKYNAVVALIMGLIFVIPHSIGLYPAHANPVVIINTALPNVGVILVALMAFFLIIGLFGGSTNWTSKVGGWVALLSFIVVGYIFGRAAGWFHTIPSWLLWLDNPDTQAILIVVAVFGIIVHFITKEPKDNNNDGSSVQKAMTALGEFLGKPGAPPEQ